jgi:protein O-GlcNAc transferase
VALAEDSDRLYSLRQQLESRRLSCAAFDTQRWVRNMEAGLTEVWRRHDQGMAPGHIEVEDAEPTYIANDGSVF